MSGTPPFISDEVAAFFTEQGFITTKSGEENCVHVFHADDTSPKIFLGTLNFSNPSHYTLRVHETENLSKATDFARLLTGRVEKSVFLI